MSFSTSMSRTPRTDYSLYPCTYQPTNGPSNKRQFFSCKKMKARIEIVMTLWISVLIGKGFAFVPPHGLEPRRCGGGGRLHMMAADGHNPSPFCRNRNILYSTPSNNRSEIETTPPTTTLSTEEEQPVAQVQRDNDGPPLNVPSPLLLATSIVLAIASIGKCIVPYIRSKNDYVILLFS